MKLALEILNQYGLIALVLVGILTGLGYAAYKITTLLINKVSTYANSKHSEAITVMKEQNTKLDKVADKITELDHNMVKQGMQLEYGTKEFSKLNKHNDKQDDKIHKLSGEVHSIKNKMVTADTIKLLIKAEK